MASVRAPTPDEALRRRPSVLRADAVLRGDVRRLRGADRQRARRQAAGARRLRAPSSCALDGRRRDLAGGVRRAAAVALGESLEPAGIRARRRHLGAGRRARRSSAPIQMVDAPAHGALRRRRTKKSGQDRSRARNASPDRVRGQQRERQAEGRRDAGMPHRAVGDVDAAPQRRIGGDRRRRSPGRRAPARRTAWCW